VVEIMNENGEHTAEKNC